jgi:fatty-acyl-CoA synthase
MIATVSAQILAWAHRHPEAPAITMGERSLSYAELGQGIQQIAAMANRRDFGTQKVVLVFLPQTIDAVICYFGLMHAGLIPSFMPLPSHKQDHHRYWVSHKELLALIQPAAVIGPHEYLEEMRNAGLADSVGQLWPFEELARAALLEAYPPPPVDMADIALLQHSSGTTALKKGVALSHSAIDAQVRSYAKALGSSRSDVIVSWLPMYHDMGLIACTVTPLMLGQHVVMLDPFAWVANPQSLFAAITHHQGTLVWLPNFAFELLAKTVRPDPALFDLSSVRAFVNCSEPCKPRSFEAFHKRFAGIGVREEALQVSYAMAETVFAVTQTQVGEKPQVIYADASLLAETKKVVTAIGNAAAVPLLSAGRPISGIQVVITDEQGETLCEDCVGEIELAGEFLFSAYYGRESLTREKFRNGRYRTNDLGFFHAGELFVLGRNDDLIIVHGRNYFAHEIEALANAIPGLKPGRNVAIPVANDLLATQEVVLLAEASQEQQRDLVALKREIKAHIQQGMGLELRDVSIVPTGWLLKSSSGKISRSANLDKYLRREHAMPNTLEPV